jgi:hypothetical protein
MKFRPRTPASLALLSAFLAGPAHAWEPKVHRVVCTVAWDEITEAQRNRVREILGIIAREQFADACARATNITCHAGGRGFGGMSSPARGTQTIDLERDCPLPASCLVREIERNIDVLKGTAPGPEKAIALALLGHLVADVHQPLNLGLAEDGGGERIAAIYKGRPTTMRAIWEEHLLEGLPEPTAPDGILRIFGYLFRVGARSNSWTETRPLAWAQESLWVMRTPATGYLGNPGGLEFGELYVKQNEMTAVEQADKASVRLAHVLRGVLP